MKNQIYITFFLFFILFFSSCDLNKISNTKNEETNPIQINLDYNDFYQNSIFIYNNITNSIDLEIINTQTRTPEYLTFNFFGQDYNSEKITLSPLEFYIENKKLDIISGSKSVTKEIEIKTQLNKNSQKKIIIPYQYSFNYKSVNSMNICFSNELNYKKNCNEKSNIISTQSPLKIDSIETYDYNNGITKLLINLEKPSNIKLNSNLKNDYDIIDLSDEKLNSFNFEFIDNNNIDIDCLNYGGLIIEKIGINKFKATYNENIEEINLLCSFSSSKNIDTFTIPIEIIFDYIYFTTNAFSIFVE